MARRKAKKRSAGLSLFIAVILMIGAVAYYFLYIKDKESETPVTGEFSIHFLELGNKYTGDCVYIKAGENDILIDAGSRTNSVETIRQYINQYVTDNALEYVIATHADQDHIAGFSKKDGSIFDLYECGTIIDFARTDKTTQVYNNYVSERDDEVNKGAKHYTALQCYNQTEGAKRVYELADGVSMQVLYNYYYENKSSDENNYSVCLLFKHGERSFLLTGDLEKDGEERLVENNILPDSVELYKAGHHGSKTSSNEVLLNKIQPKIIVVTCVAGSSEYTEVSANQFPTQQFIDRAAKYTDKVYVTSICENYDDSNFGSMNGNVVVVSGEEGVKVQCSANQTLLKDTQWFRNNRTIPQNWAN